MVAPYAEHLLCDAGSNEQTGVSTCSMNDGLKERSAALHHMVRPGPEKASLGEAAILS